MEEEEEEEKEETIFQSTDSPSNKGSASNLPSNSSATSSSTDNSPNNTTSSTIQPSSDSSQQSSKQIVGGIGADRFPLYISTDSVTRYTIFAPTNAAFALLDEETLNWFFNEDGMEGLRYLLGYHLINQNSINFQKLICGLPYVMDNGQTSLTKCDGRGKKYQVGGGNIDENNEPEVGNGNEIGDNGVVHVVNRVIIPLLLER